MSRAMAKIRPIELGIYGFVLAVLGLMVAVGVARAQDIFSFMEFATLLAMLTVALSAGFLMVFGIFYAKSKPPISSKSTRQD